EPTFVRHDGHVARRRRWHAGPADAPTSLAPGIVVPGCAMRAVMRYGVNVWLGPGGDLDQRLRLWRQIVAKIVLAGQRGWEGAGVEDAEPLRGAGQRDVQVAQPAR